MLISFLFLHENICCGYSLEAPRQGAFNEYHNICFHGEIRKILCGYPLLSVAMHTHTHTHTHTPTHTHTHTHNECKGKKYAQILIPRHVIVVGYYVFTLDICVSVRQSGSVCILFWININGFSPNLICVLILWRSALGLLMGKFWSNFDGVICPRDTHIFVSGW